MIKIENLSKKFVTKGLKDLKVFENLNLEVSKGDYISIMGTSGIGKTTILNIIGLIEDFDSGVYKLDGINVKNLNDKEIARIRGEKIGYVFQDFFLLDDLTVYENILISHLFSKNKKRNNRKKEIKDALKLSGLDEEILNKKVGLLSGGQKQRVAIARAITNKPEIILADEPTGSIDVNTKDEILTLFDKLNDNDITIILITHDETVANRARKKYIVKDLKIERI